MRSNSPWASCVLTRMLILYLEQTGKGSGIDYHKLLHGTDYLKKISDPKAFLADYNNWVPRHILISLIQAAEKASGSKEITYFAAKHYFLTNQAPSLIEIIAKLLNNMEQILLCSNLWASGYTNYLKLQCLYFTDIESHEVILLSQFGLNTEPTVGNINFIKGNYEGFTKFFDYVKDASCIEEISQVKIETFIKEFGNYHTEKRNNQLSIIESASKREVARARKVYLKSEVIPFFHDEWTIPERLVILPEHKKVTVLSLNIENNSKHWKEENAVYEIVSEGTLQSGPVKYTFQKGQLFNAAYSRYRFKWKSKIGGKEPYEIARTKSEFVPLLFEHLHGIRETQSRQLQSVIENVVLARANEKLKTTLEKESSFFGIIGKSPCMKKLFEQVELIARADSTVMIIGETGTGKELLARAIHQASLRSQRKFLAINCAALPEGLLESELFGYEKGAFTGALSQKKGIFEAADEGTLFLDEVGDISSSMQAKLLRVLEEQEVQRIGSRETISINIRLISATNTNIRDLVASGKFRKDLSYRLNVISLVVPSLRERLEDLPLLVDHYLDFFCRKCKKQKPAFTREALNLLNKYYWPGNIRELKNVIERAVVLDRDQQITLEDIILPDEDQPFQMGEVGMPKPYHESVKSFKCSVIENALKKTDGNQTRAAKLLGVQRTYLARLIRLHNISPKS